MSDAEIIWRIENLQWDIVRGGVVTAMWSVIAREGSVEGKITLQSNFSPDPEGPGFIPIHDLTESQVIDWVKNGMPHSQVHIYEAAAMESLARAKMPPLASGIPWSASA